MFDKLANAYCRLLDSLMALLLAAMVVLVLGNVVLRYVFNSGLAMSEELSRWMFVWLTFLGAIVALQERGHLGSDMLVSRLGVKGKRALWVLGHGLMLFITWLIFRGSLEQVKINWDVEAPVSGLSMGIFYATGLVFSVSAAMILLRQLWQGLAGQLGADELVMVKESEEAAELESLQAELAREPRQGPP